MLGRRRDFFVALGAAAGVMCVARVASAQPPDRVRRVGVLLNIAENDPESPARLAEFREGLSALGWREGRSFSIEFRWSSGDLAKMRVAARELVALAPDVLIAEGTPATAALRDESRTTPIVFTQVGNPVGSGFVASLARPGGTLTGFTNFEPSMGGKWLELLKEVQPQVGRAVALFNPQSHSGQYWSAMESAAPILAIAFNRAPVHSIADIEGVIDAVARDGKSGLVAMPDSFTLTHREVIAARATLARIPLISPLRNFATSGALMSYGINPAEFYRLAAFYADRILRGEKPGALPVQAPTRFQLVINLRTAKAIGIPVSPALLARADEVIE